MVKIFVLCLSWFFSSMTKSSSSVTIIIKPMISLLQHDKMFMSPIMFHVTLWSGVIKLILVLHQKSFSEWSALGQHTKDIFLICYLTYFSSIICCNNCSVTFLIDKKCFQCGTTTLKCNCDAVILVSIINVGWKIETAATESIASKTGCHQHVRLYSVDMVTSLPVIVVMEPHTFYNAHSPGLPIKSAALWVSSVCV